jgi:hypothetical protein
MASDSSSELSTEVRPGDRSTLVDGDRARDLLADFLTNPAYAGVFVFGRTRQAKRPTRTARCR